MHWSQQWRFKVATVCLIWRRLLTLGIGCFWAEFWVFLGFFENSNFDFFGFLRYYSQFYYFCSIFSENYSFFNILTWIPSKFVKNYKKMTKYRKKVNFLRFSPFFPQKLNITGFALYFLKHVEISLVTSLYFLSAEKKN